MRFYTLDMIVRGMLLEKRLPLHFYVEFLVHASNCLRELTLDTLKIVNTTMVHVNSNYSVDIPPGTLDVIAVSKPRGARFKSLPRLNDINSVVNKDEYGTPIPFGQGEESPLRFFPDWEPLDNFNEHGEYEGGNYGIPRTIRTGYDVFPERNQIQLTENINCSHVLVMTIPDGSCIDSASQVTPKAINAITQWTNWKRSPNADNIYSPEGRSWGHAWKQLRSRVNPISGADIKYIIRKHTHRGIKG